MSHPILALSRIAVYSLAQVRAQAKRGDRSDYRVSLCRDRLYNPAMPRLESSSSAVIVVDIQPTMMKAIWEADRVRERSRFLVRCADALGVPILGTVQNPERFGALEPEVGEFVPDPVAKMEFSALVPGTADQLRTSFSRHVVLVGVEAHVCVAQTAVDLIGAGYQVVVTADAVSSRTERRMELGLERVRAAGATLAHTEGIVYEWMRSADHPRFRDVLAIVKETPLGA